MLAGYTQALRGSHPNVRLQFSITALLGIAIDGGIYAIIFNLFILRLGYGPEFVGIVNSVANLVFAAGSLIAGWLGMQWGQRRTMIAGLVVLSVGSIAVPLATVVPASARGGWIMLSFVVAYSGLALYYVNSGPFLLRVTSTANRGNIFALQSAISSIASFTGSIIGGLLPGFVALLLGLSMTQPGPYQAPLFLVAGLTVVSLLVLLRTREPAPAAELDGREELRAGGAPSMMTAYGLIAFMAVVRFLQVAGVGSSMTFFNVYMDESLAVATVQIGFWAAMARLAAVPAALIGPSLSRRIGFGATGASASLLAVLGMLPLALIPSPAAAGIGFTVMLAGTSLRYPAFYVYMMERTPERLRSAMNGANEMAAGLSFSLMSFVGGIIIVDYGYSAAFLAGAFLSLLGTLLFAFYVRKRGELVVYESPA